MFDKEALSKLIRDSGVPFRENGRAYVFTCPKCQKKDKLSMYKETGGFICYYCASSGFKGRAEFALRELLGLPLRDIQKRLYGTDYSKYNDYLDISLIDLWQEDDDAFTLDNDQEPPIKEVVWSPDFVGLESPQKFIKGARYLHSRGLNAEHVLNYDLKYSTIEQRVIFPVKVDGKLVGWQGRYIGPTEFFDEDTQRIVKIPKILTSKTLQAAGGRYLMFQDRLVGSQHCVLSEGPITAIKAHKCGGNVASMGKAVTQSQLKTIAKHCRKLYIALDTDAAEDIMRIVRDTHEQMELYLMTTPQNLTCWDDPDNDKDNGDLSEEEVYDLFRAAKPEPLGKIYVSLGNLLVH